MNDIGRKIRTLRESLGMTQEELAHKVGYKSRVSINKIELQRDVPLKKLAPIAEALGTTPSMLAGWEEEPSETIPSFNIDKMVNLVAKKSQQDIRKDEAEEELLKQWRQLDGESKKQLMLMIKFFKNQNK